MKKVLKIKILDTTYFLIDKFNYQRVTVVGRNDDVWLFNASHPKFNLIRLTRESLADGKKHKADILVHATQLSTLLNVKNNVLSIHFNDEIEDVYFEPGFYQALVNDEVISPILTDTYKDFNLAFLPIEEDLDKALKYRELKMIDLVNKPKAKRKFKFKKITLTQILIIINFLIFIFANLFLSKYSDFFAMIFQGALYKNLIYAANEWWRIITAGFIHADALHLLMNSFALFQTGILIERTYGKWQMLVIYFSGMITASLLALVNASPTTISVGSSGAIFGLIGGILVYLFTSDLYKVRAIRNQIINTLMINLLISLLPGISFYGHLGGLIGGILAALIISKSPKVKELKIHAIISSILIIISMLGYILFLDKNIYDVDNSMDKHIVEGYKHIGLNKKASKLEVDFKNYYEKIGEDY